MSTSPEAAPAAPRGSAQRLLRRGILLLAALAGEYLLVSFLFDARTMQEVGWAGLAQLGMAGQLAIAVAAATLLLGGARLRGELVNLAALPQDTRSTWPFVAAHVVAFGAFLLLTNRVFAGDPAKAADLLPWIVAWLINGGLTVALLVPACIPPRILLELAKRTGPILIGGLVVGTAALGAGLGTEQLWRPLGDLTLASVEHLLLPFAPDAFRIPEDLVVGTDRFSVIVTAVCSGYESIGLMLVLSGFYLVWFRRALRFPAALLLIPIAVLASWLANVLRITALILVGTWWSEDVALGGFHSKAGWVLFCAIALGLMALCRRSSFFSKETEQAEEEETWNPTAAFLIPLLAVVATALFSGLFIVEFDYLYPVRVAAALAALVLYRGYFWQNEAKATQNARWWSWLGIGAGVAVFALWLALWTPPAPERVLSWQIGLARLPTGAAVVWVIFRVIGAVVTVPLVEELAFRGFVLRRMVSADFTSVPFRRFTPLGIAVSSVAFGALHQAWIAGTLAGVAYALVALRSGRLGPAVVAHGVTNGLLLGYAALTGAWPLVM